MAEKRMQSQVNCSRTQRSHQLLFSLQKESDGEDEKRRDSGREERGNWRLILKQSRSLSSPLQCFIPSAQWWSEWEPLKNELLFVIPSIDGWALSLCWNGRGADERKNHSGWTKLISNHFPVACVPLSQDLAPDLWGGGLWVIARALPAPAVLWFVAEGSQLQPSRHFVQDGYCLQGERGRKTARRGTNCEEGWEE